MRGVGKLSHVDQGFARFAVCPQPAQEQAMEWESVLSSVVEQGHLKHNCVFFMTWCTLKMVLLRLNP